MLRRIAVLGLHDVRAAKRATPSDAGLLELIWEMSGPQMIGSGFSCLYNFGLQKQECRLGGVFLKAASDPGINPHGPFLVLGGSGLVSTSKDSDTQEYGWFDANMVAFEPGIVFSKASTSSELRIAHGTGMTWGLLFGDNFRRFDKFGFSIIPIEVSSRRSSSRPKSASTPTAPPDDEFGFGPRLDFDEAPQKRPTDPASVTSFGSDAAVPSRPAGPPGSRVSCRL